LVWLKFFFCLVVILFAGTKLARYADVISEKTGLGRTWIGLTLLAIITTMPELATGVSAVALVNLPNLALGNFLGSCIFNLTIIAVLDMLYRPTPLLSGVGTKHLLPAGLGILLISLAAGNILAGESFSGFALGRVGIPTIIIFISYLLIIRRILFYERQYQPQSEQTASSQYEELDHKTVYLWFTLAALAIIGAGIWLAFIGNEITATYSWSDGFVGSLFLAIATSMPELVVSIAAVRLGAVDMAIAGILGANMLNMANLFIIDLFYGRGPILSSVESDHLITAAVAIAMTLVIIGGIMFRQKQKTFRFISWYAVVLIGLYLLSFYAMFSRGAASG
jgi:cation:H+ antiporter|tara:strand:- start:655 stop:1665 length:1011 start_codon:yes stop_codon:yes gene_type:complete